MNISFLIKGVSIWIELTLIFFHLSRFSALVKRRSNYQFLPQNPPVPGSLPQHPPPPNLRPPQLTSYHENRPLGPSANEISSLLHNNLKPSLTIPNPIVIGSSPNPQLAPFFKYKSLSQSNSSVDPQSHLPNRRIDNPILMYITSYPLHNPQFFPFPNLPTHQLLPYPPSDGFPTTQIQEFYKKPRPWYFYRPHNEFETEVYAMAGEVNSTKWTTLCDLECRARGYRTYKDMPPNKCMCIETSDVLGAINMNCDKDCDQKCIETKNQDAGHCDKKQFCYCYKKNSTLVVSGRCFVPLKFCEKKCKIHGYKKSSCLAGRCNCGKGVKLLSFDYENGPCAVPKEYCRQRCGLSPPFEAHCLYDQCICSKEETYFVLDLFTDDSNCAACMKICKSKDFEVARCISGDCLCHTDNKFQVISEENANTTCHLPKDLCLVHCAYMGFRYQALCRNKFSCFCGEDGMIKAANFLTDKCDPVRQTTEESCNKLKFSKGLCSNQSRLCYGTEET